MEQILAGIGQQRHEGRNQSLAGKLSDLEQRHIEARNLDHRHRFAVPRDAEIVGKRRIAHLPAIGIAELVAEAILHHYLPHMQARRHRAMHVGEKRRRAKRGTFGNDVFKGADGVIGAAADFGCQIVGSPLHLRSPILTHIAVKQVVDRQQRNKGQDRDQYGNDIGVF
jgi:hypothetical protein